MAASTATKLSRKNIVTILAGHNWRKDLSPCQSETHILQKLNCNSTNGMRPGPNWKSGCRNQRAIRAINTRLEMRKMRQHLQPAIGSSDERKVSGEYS
ncbi:MAG: hypothetical protein ABIO19_11250 [Burkholderiaceae bacterium]